MKAKGAFYEKFLDHSVRQLLMMHCFPKAFTLLRPVNAVFVLSAGPGLERDTWHPSGLNYYFDLEPPFTTIQCIRKMVRR